MASAPIECKLPEVLSQSIASLPIEYLSKGDTELIRLCEEAGDPIVPVDTMLRISFWREHDRAKNNGVVLTPYYITDGICSMGYFVNKVVKNPLKLAFILTVPHTYKAVVEEALHYGLTSLREAMVKAKHDYLVSGDVKILQALLKVVEMFDLRVHGSIIQRNVNLNIDNDKRQERLLTPGEVEDKLRLLDVTLGLSPPQPAPMQEINYSPDRLPNG